MGTRLPCKIASATRKRQTANLSFANFVRGCRKFILLRIADNYCSQPKRGQPKHGFNGVECSVRFFAQLATITPKTPNFVIKLQIAMGDRRIAVLNDGLSAIHTV